MDPDAHSLTTGERAMARAACDKTLYEALEALPFEVALFRVVDLWS